MLLECSFINQTLTVSAANVHILDGNAKDLVKECDQFEEKIVQAGGIDLFVGGKSGEKCT